MCTVTFIARRNGYALGMNRDERLSRVDARPPARAPVGKRLALFPSEPAGGTWIGVNDAGVTFALINWYSVPPLRSPVASRGHIVRSLLAADSPSMSREMLGTMPLDRVNPFRVIGIFPASCALIEWRWNVERLECIPHPWQTNTWISSGFDEPGAQQTRGKVFAEALRFDSSRLAWLRQLHSSHAPACGPYSHCMHRPDAQTVSYTEITVSHRSSVMRYVNVPPCWRSVPVLVQTSNCGSLSERSRLEKRDQPLVRSTRTDAIK